jgi:hypothetical protein
MNRIVMQCGCGVPRIHTGATDMTEIVHMAGARRDVPPVATA